MMGWIKKAPTPVVVAMVIVCGLGVIATIGGFVALEFAGRETADYRAFVNLLMNAAMLLITGTGTVAAVSAARSASNTEEQTNGLLTEERRAIASEAAAAAVARYRRDRGL